jgi:ABC transporter substrate binding protein
MKRREFITLLGGAAVAWPLGARAQPSVRVRRIGIFMNLASDDAEGQSRNAAFLQGLQELGWAVGRNVRIDYRWGASNSDPDRMRKDAAELLTLAPDVVLATTAPIVVALQQVSRTVPIVFATVIDPVGAGVVASLARPGGNATGFITFEYGIIGFRSPGTKHGRPVMTLRKKKTGRCRSTSARSAMCGCWRRYRPGRAPSRSNRRSIRRTELRTDPSVVTRVAGSPASPGAPRGPAWDIPPRERRSARSSGMQATFERDRNPL